MPESTLGPDHPLQPGEPAWDVLDHDVRGLLGGEDLRDVVTFGRNLEHKADDGGD
jgi:hypothetical protein